MRRNTKIVIVGAGNVGSSIAFNLMLQGECSEIVLIDINEKIAAAQALDLNHCAENVKRTVTVYTGTYRDCQDADIVVITAAKPLIIGQSRLDMTESSAKIIQEIVPQIMESNFNGHFIVITNPVDIMTYCTYKLSGLPKNKVIGTGTSIDTARLKKTISDLVGININDIQAYSIGEHGDSQIIPWSIVTIGGKSLHSVLLDNVKKYQAINLDEILKNIKASGWKIANIKGSTYYGIAATTVSIIRAIVNNENRIIPVSAFLGGEFGERDIYASVPAIINGTGIKEIVQLQLTKDELLGFKKSVQIIRNAYNSLELDSKVLDRR